jgi:sugar/nucleoside kinase (ribokinase family)
MRLGILGTMVWDRIEHPHGPPVERWGGIAYSLAAAAAALPPGWTIRPILKVGRDLADAARAFVDSVPGADVDAGWIETAAPNNRVRLRYRDAQDREEILTGGVSPWTWEELAPRLDGLDALFVNLVSGFELDLETASRLRGEAGGPVYADLHSLLLGVDESGHRVPCPLDRPGDWLAAFDLVQMNEAELALAAGEEDPWALAERAVVDGTTAVLVTRGAAGASVLAARWGPAPWTGVAGAVERRDIPLANPAPAGDPTGCGDVWGATCFVSLLRGEPLLDAARSANQAAERNARHRGADGLYTFLRSDT